MEINKVNSINLMFLGYSLLSSYFLSDFSFIYNDNTYNESNNFLETEFQIYCNCCGVFSKTPAMFWNSASKNLLEKKSGKTEFSGQAIKNSFVKLIYKNQSVLTPNSLKIN